MSATSCTAEVAERVKLQKHICSSSADEVNEIKARLHLVFSSEMHPNTGHAGWLQPYFSSQTHWNQHQNNTDQPLLWLPSGFLLFSPQLHQPPRFQAKINV